MPVSQTWLLEVPGLVERPAVGTSCCVTTAEALLTQELWMLPGIENSEIDPLQGTVLVRFDAERTAVEEIAEALREVGYPPSAASPA